jgi:hypothetical protein
MKTLFVSLVAFLFAFFFGCQNSITDPVVSENAYTENYANKDVISTYPEVIKLQGMLDDPRQSNTLNSGVEINGDLRYSLETVYFDSPPPAPQSAFKVRLYVHAQLKANSSQDTDIWTVKGTSEDLVNKTDPAESIYYIQKSFRVKSKCPVPMDLVLKFQVDEKEISLVSMDLKKVHGLLPIPDPEM